MAYLHLRAITIDPVKVAVDLTDYPVLINGTYAYLATVANGGDVENINGYDIIFVSDPNSQTALLDWEIESYDPVTGNIQVWVKVPAVSNTDPTIFYMWYGNAAISTFQGDTEAVWKSDFVGVWHLDGNQQGVAEPNCDDSTSNHNNGTTDGLGNQKTVPGQIDGGSSFTGGGEGIVVASAPSLHLTNEFTVSGWFRPTPIGDFGFNTQLIACSGSIVGIGGGGGTSSGWALQALAPGPGHVIRFKYFDGAGQIYVSSTATLTNNVLYFLTFTWSATAGQLKIYINGTLAETVATGTTPIQYSGDDFNLGGFSTAIGGYAAFMDEVRMFAGVQPAGWIETEYNNEFDPPTFYEISPEISPFTADCGNPPNGTVGVEYTHTFPTPVTGGVPPFFFALLTRDHETFTPEDVLNNITLNGDTGEWTGFPVAPGTYDFTLDVFDALSIEAFVDCSITIAAGEDEGPWVPEPPPGTTPGAGWDFSETCARQGNFGLRHIADGTPENANAKAASLTPITVEAGWTLFTYLYVKGSGGADGSVGFGFQFYDEDGVYLSEEYVFSTGSPTVWTKFEGNITVPAGAVTAIPIVQVIDHLHGTWCIDDVFAVRAGGNFILSSVKSYFDQYTSYR